MPNVRNTKRVSASRGNSRLTSRLLPGPGAPSTGAQKIVAAQLPGSSTLINTQATTGLLSTNTLSPSLSALNKTSNWQAVFDEYRILGVDFHIIAMGANAGVTQFLVDDEDATSNNATFFEARPDRKVVNNHVSSPYSRAEFHWRAQDLEDLEWRSTYSDNAFVPAALKFYSSLSEYATPASITGLYHVYYTMHVEFRGVGAQR